MAQRSKNKARRAASGGSRKAAPRTAAPARVARMPFERQNYVILLGAIALIVAGYAVMLVDNATNANPVDSTLSLTVAPLLLLAGYLGVGYAILTGIGDDAPEAAGRQASGAAPAPADETTVVA